MKNILTLSVMSFVIPFVMHCGSQSMNETKATNPQETTMTQSQLQDLCYKYNMSEENVVDGAPVDAEEPAVEEKVAEEEKTVEEEKVVADEKSDEVDNKSDDQAEPTKIKGQPSVNQGFVCTYYWHKPS